jgi:VWFA-related protein
MRWLCLFVASAFLAAAQSDEIHASAQAYTPPQFHLAVQSQLVQLEVVVRDPKGRTVGGLKQGDFEILDEGKAREIAAFSVETRAAEQAAALAAPVAMPSAGAPAPPPAPPRSTMLFFDDLHSDSGELHRTQIAAERFIKDGLGPGARAAVYAASRGLILDFTADAGALTDAVGKLRPHPRISENGLQSCPRITPYQAYLIDNNLDYSAFNAALEEMQHCVMTDPNERNDNRRGTTATDPNIVAVRAQASATWEQARRDSLDAFDAVDKALALLARAPGTRVLLMVSSGFLSGLLEVDLDAAIDRAIHAGIVIDALDAKGLWAQAPGRPFGEEPHSNAGFPLATFVFETQSIFSRNDAMNAVMAEFASGTGGLFFHNSNDLVGGFAELAAVPETTYLLAFRPDPEGEAGKYHKLKVRLAAAKGDYVQARPGYFAPRNAPAGMETEARPIDRETLAQDVLTEIPIHLDQRLGTSDKGNPEVSLAIHVDVASLIFAKRDGRHVQKLTFIGALLDADGNIVAAREGMVDFTLKDETLPRLVASGLNASLSLAAPPGPYRVRVVVQDADGKMASLNQTVEMPK